MLVIVNVNGDVMWGENPSLGQFGVVMDDGRWMPKRILYAAGRDA